MAKNRKPKSKIVEKWIERLVKQGIELYWCGQIQLKQIAENRKVPYAYVVMIQSNLIYARLADSAK